MQFVGDAIFDVSIFLPSLFLVASISKFDYQFREGLIGTVLNCYP